jgi:carbon monoxide dehydrogenase subunit G
MEVRIERRFELPAVSPARAWAVLSDLPQAAACMPGVQITGQEGDRTWNGTMQARVGPASMRFKGQVEVRSMDAAGRAVHMVGKGGDTSGSSAVMDLRGAIEPAGAGCTLASTAVVSVSGRLAQFGSRLLLPVAENMMRTFVSNFEAKAAAVEAAPTDGPAPALAPSAPALDVPRLLWSMVRGWFSSLLPRRRRRD